VQAFQRVRVLSRRDVSRQDRLVVGPKRDRKTIALVDAGFHPRIKFSDRAIGIGEPTSDFDFECRASVMDIRGDPRENITGQQAHREAVRMVKDNRVFDLQGKR
jgi:hypothetical protein